ncbi:MAG: hypothetical protein IPL32_18370 [Chloracidobacterium sp.]|nr:hypothetical protein [Chloracidobacterium sp.]
MANRDEKGRLLPGHTLKIGGRPTKRREERVLAVLDDVISDDEWREIITVAKEKALGGNYRYTELLMAYGLGKPVQHIKHTDVGKMEEALETMRQLRQDAMDQLEDGPAYVVVDVVPEALPGG